MDIDAFKDRYALPKKEAKRSRIEWADETVDIRDIMKEMGVWAPTGAFFSYKIDCPWADEHADGGRDKNCRIFGSTNIYCWASHGFITPTILYSRWKNVSRDYAATHLLDERGLLYRPWQERWADVKAEMEAKQSTKLGKQEELVSALHIVLEQDDVYMENEFAPRVRESWKKVLDILDKLWEHPDTDLIVVKQWFDLSLKAIKKSAGSYHE